MTKTQLPRTGVSQWSADSDTWPGRVGFNTEFSTLNGAVAIWGQGLNSARPVAAYSGRYWWSTDTQRLWYDTGTTWIEVSPVGGGGSPAGNTIGNAAAEGTSRIAARADHVHALPVPSTDPGAIAYGGSMSRGASSTVARSDHSHALPALPLSAAFPAATVPGTGPSVGVSGNVARADHVHGHSPIVGFIGGNANNGMFTGSLPPNPSADLRLVMWHSVLATGPTNSDFYIFHSGYSNGSIDPFCVPVDPNVDCSTIQPYLLFSTPGQTAFKAFRRNGDEALNQTIRVSGHIWCW